MRAHIIPPAAEGMPLDKYIRRAYPMCDAAMLRKALRQRDFKQDGVRMSASDPVHAGAELKCFLADGYLLGGELTVLFKDDRLAIVVKPAGLTCQRDGLGLGEDTLESRVHEMFGSAYLVNRLDHFTGGVMPIALTESMRDELISAFAEHKVEKTYICQVKGVPEKPHARLTNYAIKSPGESLVRVYDSPRPGALTMILTYDVIEPGDVSRLSIGLETGRTHQIRAQFAHAGHPLLGDGQYGDPAEGQRFGREYQALYAYRLVFNFSDETQTLGYLNGRSFAVRDVPFVHEYFNV